MGQLLRYLSLLCCAFVIASFFLFAVSQTSHASQGQANAIQSGAASGSAGRQKPIAAEQQPRRFIDQVAHDLNSPFSGVVSSDDSWVEHLVPTGLSLLVYGIGLGFVARWAAGRPA